MKNGALVFPLYRTAAASDLPGQLPCFWTPGTDAARVSGLEQFIALQRYREGEERRRARPPCYHSSRPGRSRQQPGGRSGGLSQARSSSELQTSAPNELLVAPARMVLVQEQGQEG